MSKMKKLLRRIIYKENASSESLVGYLRKRGAVIGSPITIYAPNKTLIDKTRPYLIKIGNHVRITEGVKILTHDYSWSVLKCYSSDDLAPGAVLGSEGPVEIGNNVFIGMNAIITHGVKIGNNVIIGAGSVVTRDCDSDGVYAGVPAKRIMSLDEFYRKRKEAQFNEAKNIAICYKESFGIEPDKTVFNEYFMLFATRDEAINVDSFKKQMNTSAGFAESAYYMDTHPPMFSSFEEFLDACYDRR